MVSPSRIQKSLYIACQLEEMLLMQLAVAAKAGNGAEGRAAMDADLLGLLEQPFVGQDPVVAVLLLHLELEVDALHVGSPRP